MQHACKYAPTWSCMHYMLANQTSLFPAVEVLVIVCGTNQQPLNDKRPSAPGCLPRVTFRCASCLNVATTPDKVICANHHIVTGVGLLFSQEWRRNSRVLRLAGMQQKCQYTKCSNIYFATRSAALHQEAEYIRQTWSRSYVQLSRQHLRM
jgi:hypothetical protein